MSGRCTVSGMWVLQKRRLATVLLLALSPRTEEINIIIFRIFNQFCGLCVTLFCREYVYILYIVNWIVELFAKLLSI